MEILRNQDICIIYIIVYNIRKYFLENFAIFIEFREKINTLFRYRHQQTTFKITWLYLLLQLISCSRQKNKQKSIVQLDVKHQAKAPIAYRSSYEF